MNFFKILFIVSFAATFLQTFAHNDPCKDGDGSFCLNKRKNIVRDYVVMDQCMAQPGHTQMHPNTLAFFLQEHQFCGGGPYGTDGFLICFPGQLDYREEVLAKGYQPNRNYELRNVPGNGVAAQCKELVGKDWHGILVSTNDQGDWVIRLSTTNNLFVVKREDAPEWLFFKLASAKDGGESFLSKSFGPLRNFMDWDQHQAGQAEEAKNRIRQDENNMLKGQFIKDRPRGAPMQKYAGLWSLGVDMLPTEEGTNQMVLFVRRSKCCAKIQAWFIVPTGEEPIPNVAKVDMKKGSIENETTIAENYKGILDGIIKSDAKFLSFELVDLFHPENRAQGMRLFVDFERNSIIFQHKLNGKWITPKEMKGVKNHFARGVPFHLVVILRKKGLTVNLNCYGEKDFMAGEEIVFENPHLIKIAGDYEYFNFNVELHENTPSFNKSWKFDGGISSKNNYSGIMLGGKIDNDVNSFSIKLWNREGGHEGEYNCISDLEVGIAENRYKFTNGTSKGEVKVNGNPSYEPGSEFEAYINLNNDGTFDVWMDDEMLIGNYKNPDGLSVVNYVQIVGGASGNLTKIPKLPLICAYKMSADNHKTLEIEGKVLTQRTSGSFKIHLLDAQGKPHVDMDFIMDEESTELAINEVGETRNQEKYTVAIKINAPFQMNIRYKSSKEIVLKIDGGPDYVFTALKNFLETDEFKFSGDVLIRKMNCTTI